MARSELRNPGQQLQRYLMDLFPIDSRSECFLTRLDRALQADNTFVEIVYMSSINYMVRRLITTAEYFRRIYAYDNSIFVIELRRFIRNEFSLPRDSAERVLGLLQACLDVSQSRIGSTVRNRVIREAQANNRPCYICGRSLDYTQDSQYNSAEVEHVWPNALGGLNEDHNLRVSCHQCNQKKGDYLDASDTHYEEIALVSGEGDDYFETELKWPYRIALWSKSNFTCIVCGKTPLEAGRLSLARQNPTDSWHFLNVDAYCPDHAPQTK